MKTLELTSRYDRRKVKEVRKYRRITLDEAGGRGVRRAEKK